jgi:hypothetical protein
MCHFFLKNLKVDNKYRERNDCEVLDCQNNQAKIRNKWNHLIYKQIARLLSKLFVLHLHLHNWKDQNL